MKFFAVFLIVAVMTLAVLISCSGSSSEVEVGKFEPKRWRNYKIDDRVQVYEWRDDWGRVCTWTKLYGGREQALACDWPQLNTPREVE